MLGGHAVKSVGFDDKQKNRMRPMTVRWVTAMQYEENSGCVSLRFGHEVIPLITKLEEQFTSYELQQIAGLKSAYAIRLYELLIQWKTSKRTPFLTFLLVPKTRHIHTTKQLQ
jgi:plasmid replication initiation protein